MFQKHFKPLYQWQRKHLTGTEFVLHDGPPYANGELHMGHAVNKVFINSTNPHHLCDVALYLINTHSFLL